VPFSPYFCAKIIRVISQTFHLPKIIKRKLIPSNSNALLEEFDEIGSELYTPPSIPPTVMHFGIFVFFSLAVYFPLS